MAPRRRPGKVLVGLAALVLVVAGCSVLKGAFSTIKALNDAGFPSANIRNGTTVDSWVVTVRKDTEDLDGAAEEAAGVVWRKLPLRIERLDVICDNGFGGTGSFTARRAELEERFGARDPDLDKGFQKSDVKTVLAVIGGLVVLGLLVLTAIVVLIVVLVRRSRRRSEVSQPRPPHYGPQA